MSWIVGQDVFMLSALGFAALFFLFSVACFVLILMRKTKRKNLENLKESMWGDVQGRIAHLVIQAVTDDDRNAFEKQVQELLSFIGESDRTRQWLIDEITQQQANLAGEAKQKLNQVYKDLGLKSFSMKKLASGKWYKVAQGIYELEKMEQHDCFTHFYKFLESRHADVRRAARMGLTSLAPDPLSFLSYVNEKLSAWEQLAIDQRLRKRKKEHLQDFSKYFAHSQPSVAIFCVQIAVKFNCFEYIPKLKELLQSSSGALQVATIEALTRLEAFQAEDEVKELMETTDDTEVLIACLQFLANVGDSSSEPVILRCMEHELADVRMAAVSTAIKLDINVSSSRDELQRIFAHFKNELIS